MGVGEDEGAGKAGEGGMGPVWGVVRVLWERSVSLNGSSQV